jgi:CHAD domain-containing protein
MAFELRRRKHIDVELTKIARRLLRKTTGPLATDDDSKFRDAVHESRKSLKKVRAVVAVLEGAGAEIPRTDRKRLKSASRALSRLRDSDAIVDTFDRLRRRYPKQLPEHTYARLRRGLVRARDEQQIAARRDGVVDAASRTLERTRSAVKDWTSPRIDLSDLTAIAARAYRRSRTSMRRARQTGRSAAIHQWRKDLKMLWYQLRLAKPLAIGVATTVADMRRLETALGDDHNLVVLGATLRACPELSSMRDEVRHIERLAAKMRSAVRRRAFALGTRLYRRQPKAFRRWLRGLAKRAHPKTAAA